MALVVVFSRLKSREVFVWWVVGSGGGGAFCMFHMVVPRRVPTERLLSAYKHMCV